MWRRNTATSRNDELEDVIGKEILGSKICELEKVGSGWTSKIWIKFEVLHAGEFETCVNCQTASNLNVVSWELTVRHDLTEISLCEQIQSSSEIAWKHAKRQLRMGINT